MSASMSSFEKYICEQKQDSVNAAVRAMREIQEAFRGVAEELGIETEADVVELVKEVRAERAREKAK